MNIKTDINIILKEFKKTALGKNAVENRYNDKDIIALYSKKMMLEKIKNKEKDLAFCQSIDKILKTKSLYKDCWSWERED